ncbi:LPS translocon maturation chaperone LptM [Pararhizobium gei]|uniref:LPS translocon maturation chaperone LptM n=1 Tax=Pararhizobium gei TaxID=1395951 RepID=UPI0023DB011E|nr:lipoprotein [Rhizobium gei]
MHLRHSKLLLTALAVTALTLSSCGRKGDLDRPGSAEPVNTRKQAGSEQKQPETPDRPFLLDPLL